MCVYIYIETYVHIYIYIYIYTCTALHHSTSQVTMIYMCVYMPFCFHFYSKVMAKNTHVVPPPRTTAKPRSPERKKMQYPSGT